MPFDVRYDPEHDCVMGNLVGVVDLEMMQEYAERIASVLMQHNCRRFLNDVRKADLRFSRADIYHLPKVLSTAGIGRTWRGTIIAPERPQAYSFFELAAANRGYTVRVFTDPDEALDWLKELQSP